MDKTQEEPVYDDQIDEEPEVKYPEYQPVIDMKDSAPFPEAGGIVFCKLYTLKGMEMNITSRGVTPKQALDQLMDSILYAMDRYKMTTIMPRFNPEKVNHETPKAPVGTTQAIVPPPKIKSNQPAPTQSSIPPKPIETTDATNLTKLVVKSVAHVVSLKGIHHLNIKSAGKYSQYGLAAWPEVIPELLQDIYMGWDINIEYEPPDCLKYAYVDELATKKKITHFASQ